MASEHLERLTPEERPPDGRVVIVYERVSSIDQDLARQATHRQAVDRLFPGRETLVLQDKESAFKVSVFDRPASQRAVALIRDGHAEAVCADRQDRFSRGRQAEWWAFVELCRQTGTQIVIDGGVFDFDDEAAEMMSAFAAMAARRESLEKSHRMRTRMPGMLRELGYKPGGRRKYGRNRDQSINAREADVLRSVIVPMFLAGQNEAKIAKHLNDNEISSASGGAWRPSTLATLLRRPDLANLYRLDSDLREGKLEPIISRETWDQVQKVFAQRDSGPERRGRDTVAEFLLDDPIRVTCGACGEPMWHVSGDLRKDGSRQASYVCSGQSKGCGSRRVARERVDETMLHIFDRDLHDSDTTLVALAMAAEAHIADTREALAGAERELMRLDAQLARVKQHYREGAITVTEWRAERNEIEDERESAAAEVQRLSDRLTEATNEHGVESAQRALDSQIRELRRLASNMRGEPGHADEVIAAVRAALAHVIEEVVIVDPTLGIGYVGSAVLCAPEGVKEGTTFQFEMQLHATGDPRVLLEVVPRGGGRPTRIDGHPPVAPEPTRTPMRITEKHIFTSTKRMTRPRRTTRSSSYPAAHAFVPRIFQPRSRYHHSALRSALSPVPRLGSGFLVTARREAAAMHGRRAGAAHRSGVPGRDVADVLREAVRRIERVEAAHQPVAGHLRDDRCRGDCGALRVAVDNGAMLWSVGTETEAVDETRVGREKRLEHRAQPREVRLVEAVSVDVGRRDDTHGDALRTRDDRME